MSVAELASISDIGFIIAAVGFVIFILSFIFGDMLDDLLRGRNTLSIIRCIILMIAIVSTIISATTNSKANEIRYAEYTYYYDGQEVDRDKIDPILYRHSYDDERKIVFLAPAGRR